MARGPAVTRPLVCAPCRAWMSLTPRPRGKPPAWRCTHCGNVADGTRLSEEKTLHLPWSPLGGDLIVVQAGATVNNRDRETAMVVPPSPPLFVVELVWIGLAEVGWLNRAGERVAASRWDILPAPPLLMMLAQSQDEGSSS
jgi:hypothetical protein